MTTDAVRWRERYGPWAVVTGASSGIGREAARVLAARGLHVVLVARGAEALHALAGELAAAHGVQARVVPADLARPDGVDATHAACAELEVGLLVAAAGFGTSGPFLEADAAAELGMLDVNCRAAMLHALHFGRRFAGQGRGGIVLLGSIVAYQGVPRAAHYAATKAYVQSLGEALHVELAPRGVDVLVSAPGPVHSGFALRADMRMGAALRPDVVARATLDALGRRGTAVPGALSKLLTYSLAPLPRRGRTRILAHVMRGMTRHQPAGSRADASRPGAPGGEPAPHGGTSA
jgi:short-subunit dehydrogenase